MFKRKYRLPQNMTEFDQLVDKVVKKYKLKDKHHAAAVISVAISHLPSTQARATLSYFGDWVLKSVANHVADFKRSTLKHEAQVDQLAALLKDDPNNNQARDGLEKAAGEGSLYAKKALESFKGPKEEKPEALKLLPN